MKIWTITTDDENNGTNTSVHFTEEAANASALDWCKNVWARTMQTPWPDFTDWKPAYDAMYDSLNDWLCMEAHDISEHPAIKEALDTLKLALHRIDINNYSGEEDIPTARCETAIQLLEA